MTLLLHSAVVKHTFCSACVMGFMQTCSSLQQHQGRWYAQGPTACCVVSLSQVPGQSESMDGFCELFGVPKWLRRAARLMVGLDIYLVGNSLAVKQVCICVYVSRASTCYSVRSDGCLKTASLSCSNVQGSCFGVAVIMQHRPLASNVTTCMPPLSPTKAAPHAKNLCCLHVICRCANLGGCL